MTLSTFIRFTPEKWDSIDFFKRFYTSTYSFNNDTKKALSGISSHQRKAYLLYQLAIDLAPLISSDLDELKSTGGTSGNNSKKFTAVIENVFTELYSSIDCLRKIIVAIYHRTRGLPNSTRKLFHRIYSDEIGNDFPIEIKSLIKSSKWYWDLLTIRDELTHSDLGNCWISSTGNHISYTHHGIKKGNGPLHIENILEYMKTMLNAVSILLEKIFSFLTGKLNHKEIQEICLISDGRIYTRLIKNETSLTSQSGTCDSYSWFLNEPSVICPLASTCNAYLKLQCNDNN